MKTEQLRLSAWRERRNGAKVRRDDGACRWRACARLNPPCTLIHQPLPPTNLVELCTEVCIGCAAGSTQPREQKSRSHRTGWALLFRVHHDRRYLLQRQYPTPSLPPLPTPQSLCIVCGAQILLDNER